MSTNQEAKQLAFRATTGTEYGFSGDFIQLANDLGHAGNWPEAITGLMQELTQLDSDNLVELMNQFAIDNGYHNWDAVPGLWRTFGATFDGTNDFLLRGGDLTGVVDGKEFIFAARIRFNGGDGITQMIYAGAANAPIIYKNNTNKFQIKMTNVAPATILDIKSSSSLIASSSYYNVLVSVDMAGNVYMYVDDADVLVNTTQTNDAIDFSRTNHSIGAANNGTSKFNGDINFLYLNEINSIDFSVEANRRKFFDSNGNPVLSPAGTGAIAGLTDPIIYMAGDYTTLAINNGTGDGFTITGAIDRPAL